MTRVLGSRRGVGDAILILWGFAFAGACGGSTVRSNFAGDFDCHDGIEVTETSPNRYRATGCGTSAVYQCFGSYGSTCSLQVVDSESTSSGYQPPARSEPAPGRKPVQEAKVVRAKSGGALVKLELTLDEALMKLAAAPSDKPDRVIMTLMHRDDSETRDARPQPFVPVAQKEPKEEPVKECELGWLVDGQRISAPKATTSRKDDIVTHRVRLSQAFVRELGLARKLSMRACERRWSLDERQLAEIRKFVDLYEDEMAWKGAPRKGGTGGLMAPSDGWPAWSLDGVKPPRPAMTGAALAAPALFEQLKRSVYQLEALLSDGTSFGSAVAITDRELLTNCHVVERARKLVLKREKKEWVTKLARTDPATDRCVLSVAEPMLAPVVGVRTWDSLEVGEPLYALGAPAGLELSLSNGILSGRREEKGRRFVQTTAPISPGSSGGGLFDARGNLVGVTTHIVVGRERLNQALNFAIAAEQYWAP